MSGNTRSTSEPKELLKLPTSSYHIFVLVVTFDYNNQRFGWKRRWSYSDITRMFYPSSEVQAKHHLVRSRLVSAQTNVIREVTRLLITCLLSLFLRKIWQLNQKKLVRDNNRFVINELQNVKSSFLLASRKQEDIYCAYQWNWISIFFFDNLVSVEGVSRTTSVIHSS